MKTLRYGFCLALLASSLPRTADAQQTPDAQRVVITFVKEDNSLKRGSLQLLGKPAVELGDVVRIPEDWSEIAVSASGTFTAENYANIVLRLTDNNGDALTAGSLKPLDDPARQSLTFQPIEPAMLKDTADGTLYLAFEGIGASDLPLIFAADTSPVEDPGQPAAESDQDYESLVKEIKARGTLLQYRPDPRLGGFLRLNPNVSPNPDEPVYVHIEDASDRIFTVRVDSTEDYEPVPEEDVLGSIDEFTAVSTGEADELRKKLARRRLFFLGQFEEGTRVRFSIHELNTADSTRTTTVDTTWTYTIQGLYVIDTKRQRTNDDSTTVRRVVRYDTDDWNNLFGPGSNSVPLSEFDPHGFAETRRYTLNSAGRPVSISQVDSVWVEIEEHLSVQNTVERAYSVNRELAANDDRPETTPAFGSVDGVTRTSTQTRIYQIPLSSLPEHGNRSNLSEWDTTYMAVRREWTKVMSQEIKVPEHFRFRLRAGFAYSRVNGDPEFAISTRDSLVTRTVTGDGETTTVVDTLDARTIYRSGSATPDVRPVLFLSLYPLLKNLDDPASLGHLFAGLLQPSSLKDRALQFVKHGWALSLGIPLSESFDEDFYGGLTLETLPGVDFSVGYRSFKVTENTLASQLRVQEGVAYLPGEGPEQTEDIPLTTGRQEAWYYGVTVDIGVFAKAFKGIIGL